MRQHAGDAVMYRWMGPSSSGMRPRHPTHGTRSAVGAGPSGILVRRPRRSAFLDERAEAFLRLLADALPRDHPRGVPLRRAVAEPADLADDRLRGPGRRRAGGEDV